MLKGGAFLITPSTPETTFTPEDFSEEQRQIGETTEQFVKNEIFPMTERIDNQEFDLVRELMKKAGDLGLLMIDVPEAYGGLELDKATSMLVAEKLGPTSAFSVVYSAHSGIGTLPIVYYGTMEQKEKYLEKIITGEWIAAYCLTEPGSGSDALAARTTAVLSDDGKHYILNGTKQYITNGGIADLYTIFAKVDGNKFTAFLVERTTEGLSVGPEEKKMGIKGSSTTQIILENAKVPVENVLGEIGKGHKIAFNVLNIGRFKLGAAVTGGAKHIIEIAAQYAMEREQFGQPIGKFGAMQEKIAEMNARVFASDSVVYRLAGLLDEKLATITRDMENYYTVYQQGIEEYAVECAISKVFCSEVLAYVVDEAVQIYGGYGFTSEYPVERYYRDERINRIFEGTNEINRMLIPGMLLKKAMKGELALTAKSMEALNAMMTPTFDSVDLSAPLAAEENLVENLKNIFLIISGAGVQKYMQNIKDEQEVLLAIADIAIQIFALESALLRAKKMMNTGDTRTEDAQKAVRLFAFYASETVATAARKAALFMEEGDTLTALMSAIRRFSKYLPSGLLQAKRELAEKSLDTGKYLFA